MFKKLLSISIILLLILLSTTSVFAANIQNTNSADSYVQSLGNTIEQLVNKQMNAYHWKLDYLNYQEVSSSLNNNNLEVVWLVSVQHKLNYDKAESVPVLKGKIRRLNDLTNVLSDSQKKVAQDDINKWKTRLETYINNDQEMNEYIKITTQVDNLNEIVPQSIEAFIEDGEKYVPVDDFIKLPDAVAQENSSYNDFTSIINSAAGPTLQSSTSVSPMTWYNLYNYSNAVTYANNWVKNTSNPCISGSSTVQDINNYNLNDSNHYNWYQCNDCTNYASQVLYAGGIPQDGTWYHSTLDPLAWINVSAFISYMTSMGYATTIGYNYVDPGSFGKATGADHIYVVVYNDGSVVEVDGHSNDRYQMTLSSGDATWYEVSRWVNL